MLEIYIYFFETVRDNSITFYSNLNLGENIMVIGFEFIVPIKSHIDQNVDI